MPYCVNCGAQNREGAKFCEACGKPVAQLAQGAPPPPTPQPQAFRPLATSGASGGMAKTLALAAVGIYAVAAVLTLLGGDILNFGLSLALAAGIYMAVAAPLAKGDAAAAKKGALIAGVVALLFMFFSLINGSMVGVFFNAAAAACMGLAWNSIKG